MANKYLPHAYVRFAARLVAYFRFRILSDKIQTYFGRNSCFHLARHVQSLCGSSINESQTCAITPNQDGFLTHSVN